MDKIFSGRVELELDKTGRMLLPQSWFEAEGRDRHVFVMPDPAEKCLRLVPASNMEARLEKMRERAVIDPAMNRALQVIGENAEQIEVDNEGRIDISAKLLEFAGISSQLVMVGGEWYTPRWNPSDLGRKESK